MMTVTSDVLMFYVNGRKVVEKNADPETTLLTYLRNTLRLTGSKLGCGEGGCGACTVMVSKWNAQKKSASHFAVNACLASVVSVNNCAVTTVEGIGSTQTKLHQVQERLAKFHGSQCGFCTPGFVMSMYTLLRNKSVPTSNDIETCLQGNLCRCTGYRPIISAFETFTCGKGDQCCRKQKDNGGCKKTNKTADVESQTWNPYDPTQEPIFPPELMNDGKASSPRTYVGENSTWYQSTDLNELLSLKSKYPDAKVVVGNTEVAIEMNIIGRTYKHLICPIDIPEMSEMVETETGVKIGASCTLADIEIFLKNICLKKPVEMTQTFSAMLKMLNLFAGVQIRNVACMGGNIMTGSPISDLNPILMACGAQLTFESLQNGRRQILMDKNFYVGYRKTNTKPDEVLLSVTIPYLTKNDVMEAYKQSKRKDDDIAIVNAAMVVNFQPDSNIVRKLSMAFGGMAEVTKMSTTALEKAAGRRWNEKLLEDVCQWLSEEMKLTFDAPGGMVQYRRALVTSFFFKFYHLTFASLVERNVVEENNVKMSRKIFGHLSSEKMGFSGERTWEEISEDQPLHDTVGRPVAHVAGLKHVTGEAIYLDDIPPYTNELHLALVCSTRPHAKILTVDTTEALRSLGVVDYVDVRDVPGKNITHQDERVFADGKVTCVGDVVGAIVADTHEHAMKASRKVKIEYEDLSPKIITIEDAIEQGSYIDDMRLMKGDITEGFKKSDHVLNGEVRVGGQEHFYLETQSCIAIPRNGENEMEIWGSCQDSAALQLMASECLGVSRNRVVAKTKRLGGGFGGKETRFCKLTSPTVVAAKKLGRPVRCVLTRQDDMLITGGRHPFLGRYKIGFNADGRVVALQIKLYSNGGNSIDLSVAVMEKAVRQSDNSYDIPNMEVIGYVCRTNVPSNTAFRGFGSPQTNIIVEDWITKIAYHLNMEPENVRRLNMLKNGDTAVDGMVMEELKLIECWDECMEKSRFHELRKKVDEFNKINRWKKQGISCVSSKFSVGFEPKFLNQGGALVLIYTDGTVLLYHGGCEMGQGLHTKTIQIASRVLKIPIDLIHVPETSTGSVPNASPTAASIGTDLNGMAVKVACEKIMKRLKPVKDANPDLTWHALVKKAYHERISLSATGFYKVPNIDGTWNHKTGATDGPWCGYFTSGAAVSVVEIDVLTGHHALLKTDIVVDVGRSLNPILDIGQIEGAFAQGYGLVTMEEPLHSPAGRLRTVGPGTYKIPGLSDTAKSLNIHLLRDSPNERAVYSSRAVGEPPLLLATAVLCAIKDAVKSARADVGINGTFRLDSPATSERIRMACQDRFTDMAYTEEESTEDKLPWTIRT